MPKFFEKIFSLFTSDLTKAHPKSLIDAEKETLKTHIARINENLAVQAGFIERLTRKIKELEAKENELSNRPDDSRESERQTVKSQLDDNRRELENAKETHKQLTQAREALVQTSKTQIEKLRLMVSETDIMNAHDEFQKMSTERIARSEASASVKRN
ncbi:MAG: hypothetical protein ACM3SY_18460 [Candidatus Omnitrophota bacterium]